MEEERPKGGPPSHDAPTFLLVPPQLHVDSQLRRSSSEVKVVPPCGSEEDGCSKAALKSLISSNIFEYFLL